MSWPSLIVASIDCATCVVSCEATANWSVPAANETPGMVWSASRAASAVAPVSVSVAPACPARVASVSPKTASPSGVSARSAVTPTTPAPAGTSIEAGVRRMRLVVSGSATRTAMRPAARAGESRLSPRADQTVPGSVMSCRASAVARSADSRLTVSTSEA